MSGNRRAAAALPIAALFAFGVAIAAQQLAALKVTVTVVDAEGHIHPVPRHALLISDNPATSAPQRVVTSLEGTADIRLRPGNYTVESEQPLIFQGKSYEWTRTLDVALGRETAIELTAANADVAAAPAGTASAAPAGGANASALLIDWQDSVVSIWSPTSMGSGFVIDARGLIATNQRLVGTATTAEVQFSPTKKVAARVIAADANSNVAILRIDPAAMAPARPMKLAYAGDGRATVAEKDKVWAIAARMGDPKSLVSGTVSRVTSRTIESNTRLDLESAGAPLFNAAGEVVAISTTGDSALEQNDVSPQAIRIDGARAVIAEAEKQIAGGQAPPADVLPVEPIRPFDDDALRQLARDRAGRAAAYQVAAADFDVSIITPVLLYASRHRGGDDLGHRPPTRGGGNPLELQAAMRALMNFANWSDYVDGYPPVLMIRATPKLVAGFWSTIARGAAASQGASIPSLKHVKTGFASMRLYCGAAEVTPIHPLKIVQRVGETSVIDEGLYVYAPDAIGPECGAVKLVLVSEKTPDKPDSRAVDARILQQIQLDFAPYRAAR